MAVTVWLQPAHGRAPSFAISLLATDTVGTVCQRISGGESWPLHSVRVQSELFPSLSVSDSVTSLTTSPQHPLAYWRTAPPARPPPAPARRPRSRAPPGALPSLLDQLRVRPEMVDFLRRFGYVCVSMLSSGVMELCTATAADFDAHLRQTQGITLKQFFEALPQRRPPRAEAVLEAMWERAIAAYTQAERDELADMMMELSLQFFTAIQAFEIAGRDPGAARRIIAARR